MIIIDATLSDVADRVDFQQDLYNRAANREDKDKIAASIYDLVGDKIKSMIGRASKTFPLTADQIDALAWQALYQGLNQSGVTAFKRASVANADWTYVVQRCRDGQNPIAQRIWSMLSPALKQIIESSPAYFKTSTGDAFVKELNAVIRNPDFVAASAHEVELSSELHSLMQPGVQSLSGPDVSRVGAAIIQSAFRDQIPEIPGVDRNLLGYISRVVVPRLLPQVWETATGRRTDEYMVEVWSAVKGDIAAVQQMESTGTLPEEWASLSPAQRIYQQQMRRLSRYQPAIQWWNARLRELSPQHSFAITTPGSLTDARKILEQNKNNVPESLWKPKNAPYYLPIAALAPYGLKSIERLLATEGFGQHAAPLEAAPVAQPAAAPDDSVLTRMFRGGRASQAYRFLVDRLFSRPGFEIEHAVGVFLTANPFPRQNQIAQFMESLPDDLAEDVEDAGWDRIVREIDRQVLEAGRQPETQTELTQLIAESPRAIVAAVDTIRRVVFVRTNQVIFRKAG